MTEKLYRPCVAIALFNAAGKVFVGERIDTPGAWQMPQGGVDSEETLEQAAFRELYEEIGTNKAEILRIAEKPFRYDLPDRLRHELWGSRYHGQEQRWVAMKFLGSDSDIRLNAHDNPEFSRWQWVPIESTLDLIVPFKKETYTFAISLFSDIPSRLTGSG